MKIKYRHPFKSDRLKIPRAEVVSINLSNHDCVLVLADGQEVEMSAAEDGYGEPIFRIEVTKSAKKCQKTDLIQSDSGALNSYGYE